jgi:hypothetical protein
MAYFIFLKSLRNLGEFRKNPHVKIPPKSPCANFQSFGIFKNSIFYQKRNPLQLSAQSDQWPASPPSLSAPSGQGGRASPPGLLAPSGQAGRASPPGPVHNFSVRPPSLKCIYKKVPSLRKIHKNGSKTSKIHIFSTTTPNLVIHVPKFLESLPLSFYAFI